MITPPRFLQQLGTLTEADLWRPLAVAQKLQASNPAAAAAVAEVWLQWVEALGRRDVLLLAGGFGLHLVELRLASGKVLVSARGWSELPVPPAGERGMAQVENSYASLLFESGENQKALAAYSRARAFFETIGDPLGQGNAFRGEANVLFRLGENQKALETYRKARTFFEAVGSQLGQGNACRGEADVFFRLGENQKALEAYRKARTFFEAVGDPLGQGNTFHGEAVVLFLLGENQEALEAYRKARAFFEAVGSQQGQGNTFLGEADVLFLLGENQKALEAYRKARTFFEAVGDPLGQGNTLRGEAVVLFRLGESRKALEASRKARTYFEVVGDPLGQGNAFLSEADVLFFLGENQKALEAYRKARTFFEAVDSQLGQENTFLGEADVFFRLGENQRALEAYRKARTLFEAVGNKLGQGNTFLGEADAFFRLGENRKALEVYRKARIFFEAVQEPQGGGNSFLGEARALLAHESPAEAVSAAQQALAQYRAAGTASGQIVAFLIEARSEERSGREAAAVQSAAEAVRLYSGRRQLQITDIHRVAAQENIAEAYDILIPWEAARDDRGAEALRLAEEAHSRVLLDLLATSPGPEERSERVDLQAESTRLTAALARLEEGLGRTADPSARLAIESERRITQGELQWNRYERVASLADPFPQAAPLGAAEIQLLARETGPLLLYYAARSEVWGFLVLPDRRELQIRKIDLPWDGLGEQVRNLAYDLANPLAERRAHDKARALWDRLIAPFAGDLPVGRPLTIVPHGPLHELPFEVLVDPQGRALFERWPTTIAPSASALAYSRKRHHPAQLEDSFRGFSAGNGLNLPLEEVAAISSFFGIPRPAFQPTEARFDTYKDLVAKARQVLIATRGVHVEGSRTETYLEIQPTREVHDSHLTAAEIASIRLEAELVTLAACDTSHGHALLSDERLDLTRAFLIAGAASVLATRWKVPEDTTTSQFLADYRAYRQGGPEGKGMRKDEALNETAAAPASAATRPRCGRRGCWWVMPGNRPESPPAWQPGGNGIALLAEVERLKGW